MWSKCSSLMSDIFWVLLLNLICEMLLWTFGCFSDNPTQSFITLTCVGLVLVVGGLGFLLWRASHKGSLSYKPIALITICCLNRWIIKGISFISQILWTHLPLLLKTNRKFFKFKGGNESSSSTPLTIIYTKTLFSSFAPSWRPNVVPKWSWTC